MIPLNLWSLTKPVGFIATFAYALSGLLQSPQSFDISAGNMPEGIMEN